MRGRPFEAGNRMGQGRPPGSRNKKTAFSEAMEAHGEALIKQCQLDALKGKPTAMRLCMERLLPICKPSHHHFRLPAVKTAADLGPAWQSVLGQVSRGKLSAQEGEAMASMLDLRRRAIETEQRDLLPTVEETALDLSLLTDEQLAQARQLALAASIKTASIEKENNNDQDLPSKRAA
jgi:hypothetical protein